MYDIGLPELPANRRWYWGRYGGGVELRLQQRMKYLPIWYTIARDMVHDTYFGPDATERKVNEAAENCLNGFNWLVDIQKTSARRRQREKLFVDSMPRGKHK